MVPPGGVQPKAIGTPRAMAMMTISDGRPRKNSTYEVASQRIPRAGDSFIRARSRASARPPTKAITV